MKNNRKTRQGAVALGILMLLLGHVVGTQWFAHQIRYEDAFLGEPWVVDEKMGVKLYPPHRIYTWFETYHGEGVDDLLWESLFAVCAGGVLGMGVGALLLFGKRPPKEHTAHGSARWARPEEIESWGLLESPLERLKDRDLVTELKKKGKDPEKEVSSICFGKDEQGRFFYNSGPEHVLAFAPTRSGKGVGMVIPTLLTWTESVVVTDIKGENFQITSWWRSLFSHVIYFNPTDPNSAHFNPLLELRRGPEAIKDAMNLAEILGTRPKGKDNPFWDGGARKFLASVILFTLYTQQDKTLGQCAKLLMRGDELFTMMMLVKLDDADVQEYLRSVAKGALEKDEKVRGGFLEGADGMLNLWKDPIVARNTSTSDFRLHELQHAEHPVSLFLVIPPGDLARLSPLISLLFQQLTDRLTEKLEDDAGTSRHRLLMLMDEFPQFGNMAKVEKAISYTAGYGIKWFFVTQGLPQLDDIYGPHNGFLSNCHTRLAYRCNEDKNALRLSKMLGEATGFKEQEGQSGKKGLLATLSNKSVSQVEFARPLMTPGELMQLDDDRLTVMIAGKYPTLATKLTYYDDPFFIPRYKNKRWQFPTHPLDDFPQARVTHDWIKVHHDPVLAKHIEDTEAAAPSHASQEDAAQPSQEAMERLREEAQPGGEEPYSSPVFKVGVKEVEELDIDEEMTPREAHLHLTTTSIRQEDIKLIIERGIKAGFFDASQVQHLFPSSPSPKEPVVKMHTDRSSSVSPAPSLDVLEPFAAQVAAEAPQTPPEILDVASTQTPPHTQDLDDSSPGDDLEDILSSLPPEPQSSHTEVVHDMEARIKAIMEEERMRLLELSLNEGLDEASS